MEPKHTDHGRYLVKAYVYDQNNGETYDKFYLVANNKITVKMPIKELFLYILPSGNVTFVHFFPVDFIF